ncbi:endonuclease/exonuclease/phosphatase family protein [Mycolicibacterium iranicum]|uniref:endonuclease/exonuclease/phosphatase family protein n=1 Tax=Mycolicibacterium iranicum TaxID=912594 RepID=UPI000466294B|nr:endonuclease/exonuclease/phosphatase family protein [Mycolicibacterium iranicum]
MASNAIAVRLVEWNVAMSLHTKAHLLAALNPTVAVLPESAGTASARDALQAVGATSVEWIGGNQNKGLSVAAFNGWQLAIDDDYDHGFQWVMPVHVTGPGHIRLLAVWDMNHRGTGHLLARQLGACRASIDHYEQFLSGPADLVIISGDFNNSVRWDKPTKRAKFGDFMDQLEARGFVSSYHHTRGCERGAEPDPTLWWTRNADKPYHIDYTFVSRPEAVQTVTVGAHSDWLSYSDHSPVTVDLRVSPRADLVAGPPSNQVADTAGDDSRDLRAVDPSTESHLVRHPGPTCATPDNKLTRFQLEPDSLPDMLCGVNGEGFVQPFRPTSFTAEWTRGVLVEVRIWGPRVLQDGSLGKRELDHRWKNAHAAGGIDIADLPPLIADRLRSDTGANDANWQEEHPTR